MKRIPLSNGGQTIVDDEDFESLNKFKWRRSTHGYAVRYVEESGKQRMIILHRELLKPMSNQEVDHINLDKADNRRSNLRVCTHAQNMQNRKPMGRFPYKGIRLAQEKPHYSPVWSARIQHRGKGYYLGTHPTIEDAARAYDKAAKKFFGEFAQLNFPNE